MASHEDFSPRNSLAWIDKYRDDDFVDRHELSPEDLQKRVIEKETLEQLEIKILKAKLALLIEKRMYYHNKNKQMYGKDYNSN